MQVKTSANNSEGVRLPPATNLIGWDDKGFTHSFPTKSLPFLEIEKIGDLKRHFKNTLIWGDNLSIMRSMESESVDLIYIDPPFFSGKKYKCIFGNKDEQRSFSDIWQGGLPSYLAWLNARLWEMKRLLKSTGSLCVHLDWHASHYVKVELDKIFDYENFRNEIVWAYTGWNKFVRFGYQKRHDVIFLYAKSKDKQKWLDKGDPWESEKSYLATRRQKVHEDGRGRRFIIDERGAGDGKLYLDDALKRGRPFDDVWIIDKLNNSDSERIGYPTQKPERLIKRLIESTTEEGDTVADFFLGGGTTCATAQKLNRCWIGTDISRIAVAVSRDRIASLSCDTTEVNEHQAFHLQTQGTYDRHAIGALSEDNYKQFVLDCFGASHLSKKGFFDGIKGGRLIHVAAFNRKVDLNLYKCIKKSVSEKDAPGCMVLGWGFSKECVKAASESNHNDNIMLVRIRLLKTDSPLFTEENIKFFTSPRSRNLASTN